MKGDKRVELSLRYGAAFVAAIFTAAGMGCIVGWSSPALEYLNSSESNLQITKNEKSWITPLLPVGQIFGYLLLPFVHKLANEKWTLLLSSIPQLLSWFLIIIAKNSYYIFLARLLGGIGYACGLCSLTIYLTEISTKSKRGIFLAFIQLFVSVGFIFMILFDLYFHYYYMNIIIISTLSCFVFVFFFMPDSSYFKRNEADYDDEERGEEMVVLNGPENWKMENDYFKYSLTNLKRIKDTEDIESAEDIEIKMKLLERVVFEGRVDCELEAIKRNEEEEGDNFLGKEEIGNVKEEIKNSQKRSEEDNGLKKITKTKEAMKKIEDIKIRKEDKTGKVKRKNEVKIEGIIKRDKKDVKIKKEAIKEFTNEEIEKEATKKAKKEAVKEAVKEATKEEVKKEAIKKGIKEEIKEDIKREAKKKEIEKDGKKEEMKQEAKNEEIKKEAKRNEMKKEEVNCLLVKLKLLQLLFVK
ncbi:uncharacterized protein PF11_0207-like [Leptopilina heterotoma]|uniref:uncharacterized protein PF11_0207-like n=1 Tax=Leptopilina heterotoma TaxID=63436 RepID=UPI001CA7CDFA|nr:uncharacterized protein PF11_0207-like [Leptopilina heterotoma]